MDIEETRKGKKILRRERERELTGEGEVIQTSTEEKRFRGSYFRNLTMVFTHHRTEENRMREDDDGSRGPTKKS